MELKQVESYTQGKKDSFPHLNGDNFLPAAFSNWERAAGKKQTPGLTGGLN